MPDKILSQPLLHFGKYDAWTIGDAFEGTSIIGATGSGKTSGSGQAVARSFLKAGFGGLVLCAKSDEVKLWERYCRETNRSKSLIIFGPNRPYRFNFLNYELSRPGAGAGHTENLVRLFTTVMSVAKRKSGQGGGSNQDFWEQATQQLLRNLIDLVTIARGQLMLLEIYDALVSAATSPEEFQSEAWRNSSFCWRCLRGGEAKSKTARQAHDFKITSAYWASEYPGLSSRTRSILVTSLTSMMDIFLRGILHELLSTTTNIVPELTHEGAILVIDLAVKEYNQLGQMAQTLIKYIWQRASERRDVQLHPRPTFLWCDEAQFFATATDAEFQSTARSSRIATVYLSQNIGAYYNHLGQPDTHSLMGNLQTKFFHANGDPMTNNWAADLFSKSWQFRGSTSVGTTQEKTVSKNYAASDSLDFEVLPGAFTSLRKGGPDNGYCVEAIAFQGGRIWHGSTKNHIKVSFSQR